MTREDRTFVVRVESPEEARRRMREAVRTIEEGGNPEERFGMSLSSEDRLATVMSDRNIELLRTIAREEPGSINETARLVDRDVHAVHDNLTELDGLGLLRFEEESNRRRPVVWYDDIEVDIPIRQSEDAGQRARG